MTRRYGDAGGSPRRSDVGEDDSRAQSRGLWPGVSVTCLEGFLGLVLCVGGGARDDAEGGGRREDEPPAGPLFGIGAFRAAGPELRMGARVGSRGGGGPISPLAGADGGLDVTEGVGSKSESEKAGTASLSLVADALGVV